MPSTEAPMLVSPSTAPEVSRRSPLELFAARVRQLPGVLSAELLPNSASAEPVCEVTIGVGDEETEEQIYWLKGETYDQYPDAVLHVWLHEHDFSSDARPALGYT